jgi:hypothetical protein
VLWFDLQTVLPFFNLLHQCDIPADAAGDHELVGDAELDFVVSVVDGQ